MKENLETKERKKENKQEEYHAFKVRNSILDLLIEKANINQSEFKGFFNLVMSLLIVYVFTQPIFNYINYGYFFKTSMFYRMMTDLSVLCFIWPLFHFWTYSSFILQKMILKNYPRQMCQIFQYVTHCGILICSTYLCLYKKFHVSQVIFISIQGIIHFFKMHSYTYTNRDYRLSYLNKDEEKISSYPNNINFRNFFYFLCAPTFIYEESYPQSGNFRPLYFFLKICKALFCLTLLYYIYTEHIENTIPLMLTSSMFDLIIRLYLPITIWSLILFFFLFECVLPGYSEMTTFGDRQFYIDWWNSTDLEEFNRKWNKIVHRFLHKHVYLECTKVYKLPPLKAKAVTFIISAIFHEYILCLLVRQFKPFMFLLMMIQIPMVIIGRKFFKATTFGNYFFWTSTLLGNCLIFIFYNRTFLYEYGHTY